MGLLHENITLAYSVFLGNWSSALSLNVGFSVLLSFTRYFWAFSVGQEGHTSQRFNISVAFRRPNIGRENFPAFFIEFDRHTLQP